jgi:hypothetical protein
VWYDARKYHALTKAKLAANRDLVDLVAKRLLIREGAGRSTYYNLTIPGWGWVPARKESTRSSN